MAARPSPTLLIVTNAGASAEAGHSILNDVDFGDSSESLEEGPKIRLGSLGGEVFNIEFHGLILHKRLLTTAPPEELALNHG